MAQILWSNEQKKIIDARRKNILVSAAAGSGKTAVLVERIFQKIIDPKDPVDIDQFVVVTFTRAAASQMKERLRVKIEEELEKQPGNSRLQKQIPLLSGAHISTVHSFCGYVIQNYFHRIGLDPAYRQGTDKEIKLIQSEVMEQLLEDEYEAQKEDFVRLADMSMFWRSDKAMEDMIFQVYGKAMSEPFPMRWLDQMEQFFQMETEQDWEQSSVCRYIMEHSKNIARDVAIQAEAFLGICMEPDGPYMYEEGIRELKAIGELIGECETYETLQRFMTEMSFSRLSAKKDSTVNADKRAMLKERLTDLKDTLKKLKEQFFFQDCEKHLEDMRQIKGPICVVIRLTREFITRFGEEKQQRNIVDFNDLEQFAIQILLSWDETKGEYVRTPAALELSDYFEEIMIDEYQDSNRIQDTLMWSVSRDGRAGMSPNLFMVGDIKQSIYRFRNACPELFVEKMNQYAKAREDSSDCRIDLHQNFRSRQSILDSTNAVFERLMKEDVGGVSYDEDARLSPGRTCPEYREDMLKTEVYVLDAKMTRQEEGELAGMRIQELVGEDPFFVMDKDTLRPATYKDIVILVRSTKNEGKTYYDILSEMGIPVVMEQDTGFFATREIQLMVQMLQVVDNPRNDYALAGILCSPMFSFSESELAVLRGKQKKKDLYDSLLDYQEREDKEEKLQEKTAAFLCCLKKLRDKTCYAPVSEIIRDIWDETKICECMAMRRDGARRVANLERLMELGREYDGTTYQGVHSFVRYIERMKQQKEEMGEVNLVAEEDNVVRIMTMHKSKGLEFPICMILGAGKRLKKNNTDFLTIHSRTGMASVCIDNDARTKKNNVFRNALMQMNEVEELGEEMRVLYVAMTRAMDKLIVIGKGTGRVMKLDSYLSRRMLNSYMDMILPAAYLNPDLFEVKPIDQEYLAIPYYQNAVKEQLDIEVLNNFDTKVVYDETIQNMLEEMNDEEISAKEVFPVKVSVSDIKVKSMEEMENPDFVVLTHEEEEEEIPVPAFMQKEDSRREQAQKGAAYGTIWHQALATIDFLHTETAEQIQESIDTLVDTGRLVAADAKVLSVSRLHRFFTSSLGQQMKQAERNGLLRREQPFVIKKEVKEVFPEAKEDGSVLVQGIIDGYYETDNGVVLMDYKTDSLKKGQENVLVDRYRMQMRLYQEALERKLGKPVKKILLYSFSLGKEIEVEME